MRQRKNSEYNIHGSPMNCNKVCYLQAVSMGELYGEINKLTMEWKDGLMAITVRVCVQVQKFNILPATLIHYQIEVLAYHYLLRTSWENQCLKWNGFVVHDGDFHCNKFVILRNVC